MWNGLEESAKEARMRNCGGEKRKREGDIKEGCRWLHAYAQINSLQRFTHPLASLIHVPKAPTALSLFFFLFSTSVPPFHARPF